MNLKTLYRNSFALSLSLFFALSCGFHPDLTVTQEDSKVNIVGGTIIKPADFVNDANLSSENDFIYRSTVNFLFGVIHAKGIEVLPGSSFCSGTVYQKNWIITAGHCVAGFRSEYDLIKSGFRDMGVLVEPVVIALVGDPSGTYSARVALKGDLIPHPDFDNELMDKVLTVSLKVVAPLNDIGLVHVKEAFDDWVVGAPILGNEAKLFRGESILLAGFGANKTVYSFATKTYEAYGNNVLRKVSSLLSGASSVAKEIYIGPDKRKSACSGDSGGPAFIAETISGISQYFLIGATSRGNMSCDGRSESVYTDVRKFKTWIDSYALAN